MYKYILFCTYFFVTLRLCMKSIRTTALPAGDNTLIVFINLSINLSNNY